MLTSFTIQATLSLPHRENGLESTLSDSHPQSRGSPHFTPTSASWTNAVEGLFAALTKRRLKRGVFRSVIELSQAIRDYLDAHNADPKPFVWTAPADTITAKVHHGRRMLAAIQ